MTIKVAINGYGRIGRNVLRALFESGRQDVEIVAINDLGDAKINAHLTKRDTVHGPFGGTVEVGDGAIIVNGKSIKVFSERDPAKLPWAALGVDVVLECTGIFRNKEKCMAHISAGAKKSSSQHLPTVMLPMPPSYSVSITGFSKRPIRLSRTRPARPTVWLRW